MCSHRACFSLLFWRLAAVWSGQEYPELRTAPVLLELLSQPGSFRERVFDSDLEMQLPFISVSSNNNLVQVQDCRYRNREAFAVLAVPSAATQLQRILLLLLC